MDFYLLINLEPAALIIGIVWLTAGIGYLLFLTRGFRVAPPELGFAEEDMAG
jgi:hypothetical protein